MNNEDYQYYQRREWEERVRATHTRDDGVRRIHLELAERYSSILTPNAAPAASAGA